MTHEVRTFTVSPAVIQHLIKSQAGTLGKAIAEAVINSVDAGATRIDIDLNSHAMIIRDDGHGFRTREEILATFEVFGFDHSAHDRIHGRFGLGRGQQWNWASTVWKSNTFELDVDIRNRGLDYILRENCPHTKGVLIEGTFYEPLSRVELYDVERDLAQLVKFVQVPVFVNGKQISEDPEQGSWTERTEEAFLRVSEGSTLLVYSQGVFVERMYASRVGVGGVLVTRTGHPLRLNIARNQVLHADCALWKKLNKQLKALAGERVNGGKARLDAAGRDFLAAQTSDPANIGNLEKPIFTLSTGKHVTLDSLLNRIGSTSPLTVAESGDRMAETLLRDGLAVPLGTMTLDRFGVNSVRELLDELYERVSRADGQNHGWTLRRLRAVMEPGKIHESVKECPGFQQLEASVILNKDLTKTQANFLRAVNECINSYYDHAIKPREVARREVRLGRSAAAEAYTDGQTYIAIVDTVAEEAIKEGLGGFMRIAALLVHEYAHDSDDAGSHIHDIEFYSQVHDRLIDQAPSLLRGATSALQMFIKLQGKSSRRIAAQLQATEAAAA